MVIEIPHVPLISWTRGVGTKLIIRGISINAYFYWQRKLRKAACVELIKPEEPVNHLSEVSHIPQGWMQLTQSQEMKSTLDIEVGGCHVTVNAG